MVYNTEKTLEEVGDSISADEKAKIVEANDKLKEAIKNEEYDKLESLIDELQKVSYKMSEELYKKSAQSESSSSESSEGAETTYEAPEDNK